MEKRVEQRAGQGEWAENVYQCRGYLCKSLRLAWGLDSVEGNLA